MAHRTHLRLPATPAASDREVFLTSYRCVPFEDRNLPMYRDRARPGRQDNPASNSQAPSCRFQRSERGGDDPEQLSLAECTETSSSRSVQGTSSQRNKLRAPLSCPGIHASPTIPCTLNNTRSPRDWTASQASPWVGRLCGLHEAAHHIHIHRTVRYGRP